MVFYQKDGVWHDSDKDRERAFAEIDLIILELVLLKKRNTYIGNVASKNYLGDGDSEYNEKR